MTAEIATSLKFCVNCEYIATNYDKDSSRYRCFAPQNLVSKEINLVTGMDIKHWRYSSCDLCRSAPVDSTTPESDGCGKVARWFVLKKEEPPLRVEGDRLVNREGKKKPQSSLADDL